MNETDIDRIFKILELVKSATVSQLCTDRIGRVVLVRSRGSGVWIGTLAGREQTPAGHSALLTNARRIWNWKGASECSQLAVTGPREGKIGVACDPLVHEILEEFLATPEAVAAVAAIPEWKS